MRPIAELDGDSCRRLEAVVFDIDDTITDKGQLTEESYSALWRLHRAGLLLVAVTGRPLGWCDVLAHLAPINLAIGENGAGWVWRQGHMVREGYWDDQAARQRQRARLDLLVRTVAAALPEVRLADDQRHRRVDIAFDVAESVELPESTVRQLADLMRDAGARVLISSVHAHGFFGQYDKASGVVRAVREVLGRDVPATRDRWLFVGDSGNDAPAFSYFPVSAGVANVRDHLARLPVKPAYVASLARARGFAEIADHLLAQRG
jgi:HAD superfamily hydrolase (TIGR01484 family)